MKWFATIVVLMIGLAGASAQPAAWNYEVVGAYPHDRRAFTQGLYYDGASLYLSTGQYGSSSIRLVDLASGETLRQQKLHRRQFGEGVVRHGALLYQLTWKTGVVWVYDAATLQQKGWFGYEGEGWGIASDGEVLITSNGSEVLTGRDPVNFAPLWNRRVTMNGRPLASLNELEFIKGRVYANVWKSEKVVVIHPKSGVVEAVIDCSALVAEARRLDRRAGVLNGIAYDARRDLLLVTGKNWSRIFAVRLKKKR